MITLIDSGASDSLVCASFVSQSKCLSQLPKISIPPTRFKVGNGQYLSTRYALEIPIKIQSHTFIVRAIALDTLGGINLVIGSPSLFDIDAILEFRNNKLCFRHSTFPLKLTKSVTLKPKHIHMVSFTCRLPAALRDATLIVRPTTCISNFCACHMLLQF